MRINVDDQALRDPRICKRLPRYTGLCPFGVLGRLLYVWGVAHDRRTAELAALDVDDAADHDGFAAAMVRADLADDLGDNRVRVRGITDRIGYLNRRDEIAVAGGKARAASAPRAAGGRFGATDQRQAGDGQRAAGERPACAVQPPADLDLDLAPDLPPDPDHDRDPKKPRTPAAATQPRLFGAHGSDPEPDPDQPPKVATAARKAPTARKAVDPAHDHQPAVDAWWRGYEYVHGAKPTRHVGHLTNLTRLCREHGHAEVTRRMGALLGGRLEWFEGAPDLGTLVVHFDKLVGAPPPPPPRRNFLELPSSPPPTPTPSIPFPLDAEAVATAEREIAEQAYFEFGYDYRLAADVVDQFATAHGRQPTPAERRAAITIAYQLREELIARQAEERAAEAAKRAAEAAEAAAREAANPDIIKLIDAERKANGAKPIKRGPEPKGLAAALAFDPSDLTPSHLRGAAAARAVAQRLESEELRGLASALAINPEELS
ncbi:MAG: hypothetical protein JNK64_20935 [Myxococcales bacterium]|nr:hypothetical protein [Myxococcales bacterium]